MEDLKAVMNSILTHDSVAIRLETYEEERRQEKEARYKEIQKKIDEEVDYNVIQFLKLINEVLCTSFEKPDYSVDSDENKSIKLGHNSFTYVYISKIFEEYYPGDICCKEWHIKHGGEIGKKVVNVLKSKGYYNVTCQVTEFRNENTEKYAVVSVFFDIGVNHTKTQEDEDID